MVFRSCNLYIFDMLGGSVYYFQGRFYDLPKAYRYNVWDLLHDHGRSHRLRFGESNSCRGETAAAAERLLLQSRQSSASVAKLRANREGIGLRSERVVVCLSAHKD